MGLPVRDVVNRQFNDGIAVIRIERGVKMTTDWKVEKKREEKGREEGGREGKGGRRGGQEKENEKCIRKEVKRGKKKRVEGRIRNKNGKMRKVGEKKRGAW